MITANVAKTTVENRISENQLKNIEEEIGNTILDEKFEFYFYETIQPNVLKILEENGYKIEKKDGRK